MTGKDAATANAYDFRQPAQLPSCVAQPLAEWQSRIDAMLPVKLAAHVADLQFAAQPHGFGEPDEVAPPHPLLAYRVRINDQFETILGFHRPLAVTLVNAMLGEVVEQLAEDRGLTNVEESLFDLIVRDMVEVFDEAGSPVGIRVELLGSERRTQFIRLFPPGDPLVLLNFHLQGTFGVGAVCWAWPQHQLEAVLTPSTAGSPAPEMPLLAQRLPFELRVRLGRAHLSLQQLSTLKPGDVLVLDQPVSEPLVGEIGGVEKFHLWPGRDGQRQAVQVDEVVDAA